MEGDGDFLAGVYDLNTQDEIDDHYSKWATSYDEDLVGNGYRSPQRCAEALARFIPLDTPVLDVGCGTGLSGAALKAAGFTDVSGQDLNAEMVAVAANQNIYRSLRVATLVDPFPFQPGTYGAIAAVGVIGAGAAPVSLLNEVLNALAVGDHLAFSFNDHVLADLSYMSVLDAVLADGRAEQLFCEFGPHIERLGSGSNVYVLRRT